MKGKESTKKTAGKSKCKKTVFQKRMEQYGVTLYKLLNEMKVSPQSHSTLWQKKLSGQSTIDILEFLEAVHALERITHKEFDVDTFKYSVYAIRLK